MRSNLEVPQVARAFILGTAVVAGAAALTDAETAHAEEAATIESGTVDLELEGKVERGVFVGTIDFGGWFTGTEITIRKALAGVIPPEALAKLEGAEFSAEVEGEIKGGVFTGRLRTDTPLSFDVPLTFPCAGAAPSGSARSATKSRRSVTPEPASPGPAPLKFVKPFDPNTFYPENPDAGKSMGEGNPRGFDMGPSSPLKFFVTGPARIQFQLFPWVHTDEAKRKGSGQMQAAVTIDENDKREIPPQTLGAGKIFKGTTVKSGPDDIALWDKPLVLPPIDIPPGTHEVTVTSGRYGFRVMPVGPQETSKSDIDPAIERPFEEDPSMPLRFRFACKLDSVAGAPGELMLQEVTKSPIPLKSAATPNGLAATVQRFHDDTRAQVKLSRGDKGKNDYAEYGLTRPLEQGSGHMCEFERTEPPTRSTDPSGPSEIALLLKPDGTVIDTAVTGLQKPGTMQCAIYSKAAAVMCWETDVESRMRAYRARVYSRDTTPAGKGRRHIFRKY